MVSLLNDKNIIVIKKYGNEEKYDVNKIVLAINKASNSSSVKLTNEQLTKVIGTVERKIIKMSKITTNDINAIIEDTLVKYNHVEVNHAFVLFREHKTKNVILEKAKSLVNNANDELKSDNGNKNTLRNSTIRDYFAGIVAKEYLKENCSKDILKAHENGIIHFHDADYSPLQRMNNCGLLNVKDMLENGFMMNDTYIHKPKLFSKACTLISQISLIVSGSQYGGQTITWSHLLPYVESTRNYFYDEILKEAKQLKIKYTKHQIQELVELKTKKDIEVGIKTYMYQIICHTSSNGQTPFVSNVLCLREAQNKQELNDLAYIIECILKRRIKGVQDKSGNYVTPLFPKLLYWGCEGLNVEKYDKYYYLTELSAKANVIRMSPDFESEKKTRDAKHGQIIPCMGCRSLLSDLWEEHTYSRDTKFYWQYIQEDSPYYEGTPLNRKNFNYERGFGMYSRLPSIAYENVVINFNGNSGWIKEITKDKVVVIEPIVYGRWNMGVVTINIPYVAMLSKKNNTNFYDEFDKYLELCHKALLYRAKESVLKINSENAPILWQGGAYGRLKENESITKLIDEYPNRPSISLGFAGLYETCQALIGKSNTSLEGAKLSKEILKYMNDKCAEWSKIDGKGFNYSIYSTPEENLTSKFAYALKRDFELTNEVNTHDYVTNGYHVNPHEKINAFNKIKIESQYLNLVKGGAVSYVEISSALKNQSAIETLINFMFNNIIYAEINTKLDKCYNCGYNGELKLIKTEYKKFLFECPFCGNKDSSKQRVVRRLCGYISTVNADNVNYGRMSDIESRFVHLGGDNTNDVLSYDKITDTYYLNDES